MTTIFPSANRHILAVCLLSVLPFSIPPVAGAQDAKDAKAIIVLDASGSMWGRIGNATKMDIARSTLNEVLATMPENLALGMIAYGHRKKGQCDDIELVVPVARGTAATIAGIAASFSPKGKTPLSDAVRIAAEALKYTEEKATVILITDGVETCKADPCAVGKELERAGVDFTAHVVGFGLSEEEGKKVACLATNTGGTYYQASDAGSLGQALRTTMNKVVVAPEPEPVAAAKANIDGPATVEQAHSFRVSWQGPAEKYDDIKIFDPTARNGEGKYVRSRRIIHDEGLDDNYVTIIAPAKIGNYLLRYVDRNREILAQAEFRVIETTVSLDAPETIEIGRKFTVVWQGPGERNDDVQIYNPRANNGEGKVIRNKRLRNADFENRKATMPAPVKPGIYILRYWNGANKAVLAERSIEVIDAKVFLQADETVEIGRMITVTWVGPGGQFDDVQLYDPNGNNGEGRIIRSKRLRYGDFENRKVRLAAPAKPGTYQLRYWNGDNKSLLATLEIEVIPANVSLSAPDKIGASHTIHIEWQGPGAKFDDVQIFDPNGNNGEGKIVRSQRLSYADFDNRKAAMEAPAKPGKYLLRYWNGGNKTVLYEKSVEVLPIEVSIRAPSSVAGQQKFTVEWTGPGARYDEIQIINAAGKKKSSARVRHGDFDNQTVKLKAPKQPGSYELRYWNGTSKVIFARRKIIVE